MNRNNLVRFFLIFIGVFLYGKLIPDMTKTGAREYEAIILGIAYGILIVAMFKRLK